MTESTLAFTPNVRIALRDVALGGPVATGVAKLVAYGFRPADAEQMVRDSHRGRTEWFRTHVGWSDEF